MELAVKVSTQKPKAQLTFDQKQHQNNKLTAQERLQILFDDNTFVQIDKLVTHRCTNFGLENKKIDGDGVITGYGKINGKKVFAYSQNFGVLGGSLGELHAAKICKVMDLAAQSGCPIIGINDSGGARIQEGVDALAGYGEIFKRNVAISGVVPQISLIMGPCAGGAVYSPALTDFVFMTQDTSYMFVTGPKVVKTVLQEDLTQEELGGSEIHAKKSGVCDGVFKDDVDLLLGIKKLFRFIPQNNRGKDYAAVDTEIDRGQTQWLDRFTPNLSSLPYDVKQVVSCIIDRDDFFEIGKDFAKNIVTGFGKIGGINVGIIANQPLVLAGCLDINSSRKAARFIRFCDAFNIPIVTLVDVPGFLPGSSQEQNTIIKHGAKLLYAYAEATVPKVTVILKKAYGGAYIVMGSKHLGGDINLAWPNAEVAVMGPEAAVEIIFKKELADPDRVKKLVQDYRQKFATPQVAASRGYIDNIIAPSLTRSTVFNALSMLLGKQHNSYWKKHDNLPL